MRRSASPSKTGGPAPSRRLRRDDSSSVLKAAFKPLSGLEGRRESAHCTDSPAKRVQDSAEPSTSSTRELRVKTIAELREDVAGMEAVVSEKLECHNSDRKAKGLPEQQPEQVISEYITLLTQYNKVKDSAQLVFDKIADIEQLPAKDIHARYGVAEANS